MNNSIQIAIEQLTEDVKQRLNDNSLFQIFKNCYSNTLDTTVERLPDSTAYVITGDIPAMWLRDSVCQMRPYLIPAAKCKQLSDLLVCLSKRHFSYILIDAYANAFNKEPNGACWSKDKTDMNPYVWERKYEIDSLCFPLQFAYLLWKNTHETEQFDHSFLEGTKRIVSVFKTEQYHEEKSKYRFIREGSFFNDTLSRYGKGALVKSGIGMTWSGFRPSDDACTYGYLIPSNMFAVVVLGYLENILNAFYTDEIKFLKEVSQLKFEIKNGIERYGITLTERYGRVYAYETDGFGQYRIMDDANVPSLLSMDYIGYTPNDREVAENTCNLILSTENPYYYRGKVASGIGSSHTPPEYIWHISIAMEGLTSKTQEEKYQKLCILKNTDGNTGLMHESFFIDNPNKFTREWFSWANAMFCELVLDYCGYSILI